MSTGMVWQQQAQQLHMKWSHALLVHDHVDQAFFFALPDQVPGLFAGQAAAVPRARCIRRPG
jgi:hypothetical protein